ncbi:MAG: c-di-GMP-binding flagellar brake protein YcgR [Candidatus Omnitrophota bacterium]|jgi:c-di-GMP-binding flagellar brake protein YcgR
MTENRRGTFRVSEIWVVRCKPVQPDPKREVYEQEFVGGTLDLAEKGMLIRCTESIKIGEMLQLEFKLKKGGELLTQIGQVIRHDKAMEKGIYYMAVEFPSTDPKNKAAFKAYLSTKTK